MKLNLKNILLIILLIMIISCNNYPFLFIIELLFLILLVYEKIILPFQEINKTGINKNKYYRDELSNYSPFINAILLNRNIFDADVIVAMFLYLEDEIHQKNNLLPHEIDFIKNKYFYLGYFKAKDYNNKDLMRFKKLIIDDMIKENILIEDKRNLYVDKIDLISILFVMMHFNLVGQLASNLSVKLFIIIGLFYNITWFTIYLISHKQNLSIVQILTPKGKKYYGELLASRSFLKDFSIISSRNIEERSLWNSYLYNAILFNLQGKLDKDSYEYYKSLLSKNNYYINKNNPPLWEYLIATIVLLALWLPFFRAFSIFLPDIVNICLLIYFISKSASYRFFSN